MKKNAFLLVILSAIALLIPSIPNLSYARNTKPKCLEGIEIFSGFAWGKLRAKESYHLTPFMLNFDFNLKPLIQKLKFKPRQLFQFQIGPFISFVSSPDNNIETGTAFAFKLGILPQTSKFQPYLKAGLGMVYMTQHTREQSTQFNFTEQGGLGMHYFFRKNTALTLEGQIRHLSNSGIKYPNSGINTYFVVAGISYRF